MSRILIALVVISALTRLVLAQVEPRPRDGRQFAVHAASSSPTDSASPAPRPYKRGSNLYDFVLHQLNPTDFDWGAWYEGRRRALLEATAYNPDFWYCFMATVIALVLFAALLKSMYDHKRKVHIMGEQMDQVRKHHAYSRRVAEEAIRRYNVHTELCNRVVESEQGGFAIATGEGSQVAQLQADLAKARDEIEMLKRDKSRLGAEVARPAAPNSEPSRRNDAPRNKGNGHSQIEPLPPADGISPAELVKQINSLQQQLFAEKEKNKHLKGGG